MDQVIQFTPRDIVAIVSLICGSIMTVSGALAVIVKAVTVVKAPNKIQNDRIAKCEQRLNEHDSYFKKDKNRIDILEEGNRVTQQALLALLSHAVNGNNTEELKKAEANLKEYLISR